MTDPGFRLVQPKPDAPVLVLETALDLDSPPEGAYARSQCLRCDTWVWMTEHEHGLISTGEVRPICLPCITEIHNTHPGGVQPLGDAAAYHGLAL